MSASASQATILGGGGVGGTGSSVGLGALRLDLSLSDRIAAIHAKSEERSKRFLLLRRHYLQSLKNYHLEAREQDIAIEQLRTATVDARVKMRGPERSSKFATDQEEWAAVDRMSMASTAVYFQNLELRTRLAALTNRSSGCDVEELKPLSDQAVKKVDKGDASATSIPSSGASSANNASSSTVSKEVGIKVLTRNGSAVSGGAKTRAKKGDKAAAPAVQATTATTKSKAKAPKADEDDDAMRDDNEERADNNDEDSDDNDPYATRVRTEPRRGPRHVKNASETVLGVGDLVLSVYGRGVVVRQRDPDSSAPSCITQVLLEWGANAFVTSKSLTLLCVAGEEYLGERSLDALLLQQSGVSKPLKASATSASVPQLYNADDLIMEASMLSRQHSQAGAQGGSSALSSTIAPTISVLPPTKQGVPSEQEEEEGASMKDIASTPPGRASSRSRRKSVSQVSPQKNRSIRTSATDAADEEGGEDDKEAVKRAVKRIKTKSGKTMSLRAPVFVTSWDAYGVPRGVPLRLDPARNATLGFVVAVNEFPSSSKFGQRDGTRAVSSSSANQVAALEPFVDEMSPRSSSSSSSSSAAARTGSAAVEISFKNEPKADNNSQSRYFGPGSPLHGVTSGDALNSSAADVVRQLRAQNERLTFQLRHSEEIREEQRSRLSDTKDSISRILEQLNSERETSREIAEELRVCMLEANEVTSRLVALAKRFDPASPTAQVVLPSLSSFTSTSTSTSFASLVLGSTPLTTGSAESFVISETARKRKAADAPSSASRHTQTIRTHAPQSSADSDSDGIDDEADAQSSAPAEKHRPLTRSGRTASLSLGTHGRRGGAHARTSEEVAETAAAEAAADTDDYDVMDSDDADEDTEKGNATMDDEDDAGGQDGVDESDDGLAALLELTSVRTRAQRSSQGHDLASSGPSTAASSSLAKGKKGSSRLPVVEATTSGDGGPRVGGKRRRTQDDFQEDGVSALHAIVADAIGSSDAALKTRSSNGKDSSTVSLKKSTSLSASSALAPGIQTVVDGAHAADDEVPTSKRTTRNARGSNITDADRRRAEEEDDVADEPKQLHHQNKRRK